MVALGGYLLGWVPLPERAAPRPFDERSGPARGPCATAAFARRGQTHLFDAGRQGAPPGGRGVPWAVGGDVGWKPANFTRTSTLATGGRLYLASNSLRAAAAAWALLVAYRAGVAAGFGNVGTVVTCGISATASPRSK